MDAMTIPNGPLLQATLQHVTDNPDQHTPTPFRTPTTLDFIARAVVLAGGKWAPDSVGGNCGGLVHAVDEDPWFASLPGRGFVWYECRGRRVLGITEHQQAGLAAAEQNGIDALTRVVVGLCAESEYAQQAAQQLAAECFCPADEVLHLDGVTITGHRPYCDRGEPRQYVWQEHGELKTGNLQDYALERSLNPTEVSATVRTWSSVHLVTITPLPDREDGEGMCRVRVGAEHVDVACGS